MTSTQLVRLGRLYADHRGIKLSTAGRHLANHGAFFDRLLSGHTLTEARAVRVARSISQQWPVDMPWPADVPRPPPAAYSARGTDWRKRHGTSDAPDERTRTDREIAAENGETTLRASSC